MNFTRSIRLSLPCAFVTMIGLAGPALSAPPLPKGFDAECVETALRGCTVTAAGFATAPDGQEIAWQIQDGFTPEDGVSGGVVLFEGRDGAWQLLAREFIGYEYEIPRLVTRPHTILHVAGIIGGSGSHNADLLFVHDGEAWTRIDIESWHADIAALLPEGLEIWKGVDFDFTDWFYDDFVARTPLWRGDDANCCPTGGWATIVFEIANDILVPVSVDYEAPTGGD